jgi:hypothetical protein
VLASQLVLRFMSRSRNLADSSRWGVCADASNHTSCLLGAVTESWNRCAASPGATWSRRPCAMTRGTSRRGMVRTRSVVASWGSSAACDALIPRRVRMTSAVE